MSDQQQPDWDKITEGKIRHGIAVEAFGNGMELTPDNMKLMEKWVQFIIHGYDGIKDILDRNKAMTNEELKDEVVEKFDGEVIEETDDEYVKIEIDKAISGLGQKDKNKVLYQLKNGNITIDNLQACLEKIEVMQNF